MPETKQQSESAVDVSSSRLLSDLVRAYEREINPASDWTQTALTEDEFATATQEYRAAKAFLSANTSVSYGPKDH